MSLNLPKLTDDLNVIQALPDRPTVTANELKAEFDKGNNLIKKFLNNLFIPKLDSEVSRELESMLEKVDTKLKEMSDMIKKSEEIEASLNEKLNEYKKEMETLIGKSSSYEDFVIEKKNVTLSTEIQYGAQDKVTTYSKSDYRPLGVIDWSTSNNNWDITEVYASRLTNTQIDVYVRGNSIPNHGNIYDETTVTVQILWVKIK